MADLSYAVVDVFTETPLSGNPLAVVMDPDEQLDETQMAAIAVEFNLSETTFVRTVDPTRADWWLRSFTPGGVEVAGAGHNALGAWWWLAVTGRAEPPGARQLLGDRVLPVHIARRGDHLEIGLDQGAVEFEEVMLDGGRLRAALGLAAHSSLPRSHPVGSVGSPHLLVELADTSTVDAARPDTAMLRDVLGAARAQGCYLFTTAGDADAYTRFFNPTVGISEDPATGSAAGPLAQLLHHRGGPQEVRIAQGRVMGRPAHLTVQVRAGGPRLVGRCALAAHGTLHTV